MKEEEEDKINQSQFFELITGEELSWQAIIYDLIKTEQLDPWNIDLGILAEKYIEKIQELEEADFYLSSKVLLACSLLLRLKSDLLLNKYIQGLDDALYGRKEENSYQLERIEIDEDELPILVPRTPMARHKKVTLKELMTALNKAIDTESRRIKREIKGRQAEKSALVVLPKTSRVPLKTRIKNIFTTIKQHISHPEKVHMKFSELAPTREEKLASFLPVLHLSNNDKVYLRQEVHYDEIHMTLEQLEEEIRDLIEELGEAEEDQEITHEEAQELENELEEAGEEVKDLEENEENNIPKVEGFKEGLKIISNPGMEKLDD
jgi:segregation and condensation protein A